MAENITARTRQTERLTRKQRRELGRRIWPEHPGLEVVHRDAAGIDIGGTGFRSTMCWSSMGLMRGW